MKLLNGIIPKINLLLSLSVVVLGIYLSLNLSRPYSGVSLGSRGFKTQPLELMGKESSVILQATPGFSEEIFKRKQLFNQSGKKNPALKKRTLILLGVSVGDKNLAMIRNTEDNKDYYCTQGDKIGDFRVKQILKDKVILESESGTLEINP